MRKILNLNVVVKVLVSLAVLRFFPKALDILLYVFLLQMVLLIAEMVVNSFVAAEKRKDLQKRIMKVSRLDEENRLKFRRPFSFLVKAIGAFYKKDFTQTVERFKAKA